MSRVFIVGIGPGSRDYIIPEAVKTMKRSDVILGFERAIDSLKFIDTPKVKVGKLNDIIDIINSKKYGTVSVAASGDPLFYGITGYIEKNYSGDIEVVPGISSFQYMMSKLKKNWQGAYLGSVHGKDDDILKAAASTGISIWLTDKNNSPDSICSALAENNMRCTVYVGENLSYGDESIIYGTPDKLKDMKFGVLSVVVIENLDIREGFQPCI